MSLTALQGATLIVLHEWGSKFLVTGLVRLTSLLKGGNKSKPSRMIQDLCNAQLNTAEYAPLIAAPLFYLAATGQTVSNHVLILTLVGQIGYFWSRILFSYPSIPTAGMATVRYIGMILLIHQLIGLAFGGDTKATLDL